tara:strand:- start:216 stop:614 length:399 start_codon:yes stop_codon:yes gene_type:complete
MNNNFAITLANAKVKTKEEIKKPKTLSELHKNGWTILKRNNNKNTIIKPLNEDFLKKRMEKKQIILILNKMISNWNNFRDKDIELNGDLSLYFNYKSELDKLINEINIIEEMFINDNISECSDNDYSDDGLI